MQWNGISHNSILQNLGFDSYNDLQKEVLSVSKTSPHLIISASTGSGKTVAYLTAALEKVKQVKGVQILIIAPTRELVLQIETVARQMKTGLKINACYGGHSTKVERLSLEPAPTLLIGTPGRLVDHIQNRNIDLQTVKHLIFDEFDKSLEFGFGDEMSFISKKLSKLASCILVSATSEFDLPNYLPVSKFDTVSHQKEETLLKQEYVNVSDAEKTEVLIRLIKGLNDSENAIVFANHREACNRLSEHLDDLHYPYSLFHGGLEQEDRELELAKFRNGSTKVLIATDVAARGIDIPSLSYVIHYQLPKDDKTFIHRNGRTARVAENGTSILFVTSNEHLPEYVKEATLKITSDADTHLVLPDYVTLHINKGKKDKINKIDLVGFFLNDKGMEKSDIGLIEVKDFYSYVAVKQEKIELISNFFKGQKIKKKSINITVV